MDNRLNNSCITSGSILNKDNFFHYLSSVSIGPINNLKYESVTSKEMKDIIKSLKNKKSYGYDEISMKILKLSMPFIMLPLIYICNRSLSTGIFPSRLKYSQVHPIYKKGERSEMSNYRPISVLTSISKIF
jgi:Notch-like protein